MRAKLRAALLAIDRVFSDTSVTQEETLDALAELKDDIENKIECIHLDIRRARGVQG